MRKRRLLLLLSLTVLTGCGANVDSQMHLDDTSYLHKTLDEERYAFQEASKFVAVKGGGITYRASTPKDALKKVESKLESQIDKINKDADGDKLILPVASGTITSLFGKRTVSGKLDFHAGIDFAGGEAGSGKPAVSISDGTVLSVMSSGGCGIGAIIEHPDTKFGTVRTMYCHFSKLSVKSNQKVKKGDTVGLIGNTGIGTGAHLHFGISLKDATYPENHPDEFNPEYKNSFPDGGKGWQIKAVREGGWVYVNPGHLFEEFDASVTKQTKVTRK